MQAQNLLIIMSDQHNSDMMGCYGHPLVSTPNLDRLGGARHPLHLVLDAVAGLHSGARRLCHRQIHPSDRILGQCRSL